MNARQLREIISGFASSSNLGECKCYFEFLDEDDEGQNITRVLEMQSVKVIVEENASDFSSKKSKIFFGE